MINLNEWLEELKNKLVLEFGKRLLYIGIQGSLARGEANEDSDIDAVVILDVLTCGDLDKYKKIIDSMPEAKKSCGFIAGKKEISHWPAYEIFQFLNDTKDYYGTLAAFCPKTNDTDIHNFIKISASNIYHYLGHERAHSDIFKTTDVLNACYKPVFFILQNMHYLKTRRYIASKKELLNELSGKDLTMLDNLIKLKNNDEIDLKKAFSDLFNWCSGILAEY